LADLLGTRPLHRAARAVGHDDEFVPLGAPAETENTAQCSSSFAFSCAATMSRQRSVKAAS